MFTEEEKKLIQYGIDNGKSEQEVRKALVGYRQRTGWQAPQKAPEQETPLVNRFTNAIGLEKATDVFGSHLARMGVGPQTAQEGQQFIEKPTGKETLGAIGQTGATTALAAAPLVPGGVLAQMAVGGATGYLLDMSSDLLENKSTGEVLTPGLGTAIGVAAPPVLNTVFKGLGAAGGVAAKVGKEAIEAIPKPNMGGIGQVAKEGLERIPRAFEKGKEFVETAADRAERIRTSRPEVGNAIKVGLDDVVINAIEEADEPTKAAYKRMVEIAEQPRTGMRPAVRPESVAGEAASEQYKLLDTQKKNVGSKIGEAVDALTSQKVKVDILPLQRQMRDILRTNGIMPDMSGKLGFEGTKYTDEQRAIIQRLYELATEGGEQLTPRQIYNKDQLFSQLQREARFGKAGDIIVDVPEGTMSLFRVFRNIYSNQLDNLAPEIRPLNAQYRQLRNLQDDVEDSIVKSGNFETTGNVDPAEFAQTNLRRLFSDAQSAADYRKIYENLDALSRQLGYTGARADDLAGFAQRLRQIYPETTPETSFSGGISGGIMNALGKVLDIGKPNTADKQKALKELLGITTSKLDPTDALAAVPAVETDKEGDKNFNPATALTALAAIGGVKKFHKEDAEFLQEFAFNKDKTAKTVRIVKETLESYGLQVPKKIEDIKDFLRMAMQSRFDKKIDKKLDI